MAKFSASKGGGGAFHWSQSSMADFERSRRVRYNCPTASPITAVCIHTIHLHNTRCAMDMIVVPHTTCT